MPWLFLSSVGCFNSFQLHLFLQIVQLKRGIRHSHDMGCGSQKGNGEGANTSKKANDFEFQRVPMSSMLTNAEKFWPVLTVSTSCDFMRFLRLRTFGSSNCSAAARQHRDMSAAKALWSSKLPMQAWTGRQEKNVVWELVKVPKIQRKCAIWSRINYKDEFPRPGVQYFPRQLRSWVKLSLKCKNPPVRCLGKVKYGEIHLKYCMILYVLSSVLSSKKAN